MARCEKRKNVLYDGKAPSMRRPDCCGLCLHVAPGFGQHRCGKHGGFVDWDNMVCDDFQYTVLTDRYRYDPESKHWAIVDQKSI